MNRRNFLKLGGKLSAAPLLLNGTMLRTFATPAMLTTCDGITDRVLVIIRLNGGNDGINTLIPINQYADYATYRFNMQIPESGPNAYLEVDSSLASAQQCGFHPVMTGFKDLYDDGQLNIIQAVGYPSQNRSHFKSTDIMLSGADGTSSAGLTTGWMGRYLDYSFPMAAGNPNLEMPDPLGIELGGSSSSAGFFSDNDNSISVNLGGQDASGFYNQVSSIGTAPLSPFPATEYGEQLEYIYNMQNTLEVYAERISEVFDLGTNVATYPDNRLANQLRTVARLISGGSQTKVFLCEYGGFDTHSGQVNISDPTTGNHAELLTTLSDAIKTFQDDLAALGIADRVLGCTFSEFGRKVISNGSYGTDHGTYAPCFVFGSAAAAGVVGNNPTLNNIDGIGALAESELQHDYRQVFTTLLQDWLGASNGAVTATYFGSFLSSKLGIVDPSMVVDPSCYIDTFTGLTPPVGVSISAMLEGALITGTSVMHTKLMDAGLVPNAQPFNKVPWNYTGPESFDPANSFAAGIVDWVLVELRDATDNYSILETHAALLLEDGVIVNTDGATLQFTNVGPGDYYIALRARNHLDVISNAAISLPNTDMFSMSEPANILGGAGQLKEINPGVYALSAGDYSHEGVITVDDQNVFNTHMSEINVYQDSDGNMDGNITVADFNKYRPNASKIGMDQIRYD